MGVSVWDGVEVDVECVPDEVSVVPGDDGWGWVVELVQLGEEVVPGVSVV
ncbi:hypothetical protein [Thermococcus sp. 21S9]|nr:hypothetical protein [Thermococcus sp. 21S9]